MRLFESILRERYVSLDIHATNSGAFLEYGDQKIDLVKEKNHPLIQKLKSIENKPNWGYANLEDCDNAFEAAEKLGSRGGHESFIILDNNSDDPIGAVKFCVGSCEGLDCKAFFTEEAQDSYIYDQMIYEIYLLGFKENNLTLVKDVFKLFDEMRDEYPIIKWSVANENPIRKAYLKKVKEWKGVIFSDPEDHYSEFLVSDGLLEKYQGVVITNPNGPF